MNSACVSTEQMRAFLAGRLPGDEELALGEHIDRCPDCEERMAELADDQGARELAAASLRCGKLGDSNGAITDLSRRMQALALYEAAARNEADALSDPSERADSAATDSSLTRLGRYRILRKLGSGTFGIVYLAEDQRLHRNVALKVARPNVLADAELRVRFFREAETLARLAHPHIVPVYEADEVDGLCFLAIAFCNGPTLDEWLRQRGTPLDPQLAAQLLAPLADAVEHAHRHGVLHRDIKPGNILLHAPAAGAELPVVPQLTDFGLARVVEDDSHASLIGVVLGTPQYMAPEQAAGHLEGIGPATDVYALGAVLYHMLTGRAPISGRSTIDTLRRVLVEQPLDARAVVSTVPEDLSAIIRKCLEKSPPDRYQAAKDLADDLRCFLSFRPTKARPLNPSQKTTRWVRRNPLLTALLALATAVAVLSLGLWDSAHRLSATQHAVTREEHKSLALTKQVQSSALSIAQLDYVNDMRVAAHEAFRGNTAQAMKALERQADPSEEMDLRGFEWHYLWALVHRRPLAETDAGEDVYQIRLSPDERELVAVSKDGLLRFYNAAKLTLKAAIPTGHGEVNGVAYSPSGKQVATVGDDGMIRIWDVQAQREELAICAHPDHAYGVLYFKSGSRLASCGKDTLIRLWDAASGEPQGVLEGHTKAVEALALSPDGQLLASVASDMTAIIWNLKDRRALHTLTGFNHRLTSVSFSPDGKWLAIGSLDRTATLWEVRSGRKLAEQQHLDGVQSLVFSRDGKRLKVADCSGTLRNYYIVPPKKEDPSAKLILRSLEDAWGAHPTRTWSVAAGSREHILYSAAKDGMVRRWKPDREQQVQRVIPARRGDRFVGLEFSADDRSLVVLREMSGPAVLNADTLQPERALHSRFAHWRALRILEDRDEVAAGNEHGKVVIWDRKTGEPKVVVDAPADNYAIADMAYSAPTGLLAVLRTKADDVRFYDAATGEFVDSLPANNHSAMAMSPDGRRIAVSADEDILIYDLATRRLQYVLAGHSGDVHALTFSLDGQRLASGGNDRSLRIWSPDGHPLVALAENFASLGRLQFTPDGKTLISGDDAGVLKLINVATGRVMFDVPTNTNHLRGLAVAPGNSQVAVILASNDILLNRAPRADQ